MNFLSDQDNKKMIKKAGEFLEGDFHVIINYSGMPLVNLSSPLLDPTGVSGSANVNRADKTFMHDMKEMKYTRLRKQALLEFAQRSESYGQKYDTKGLLPDFS